MYLTLNIGCLLTNIFSLIRFVYWSLANFISFVQDPALAWMIANEKYQLGNDRTCLLFKGGELGSAYLLLQSRRGEPWQIVLGDELIGMLDKIEGSWQLESWADVPEGLCDGLSGLIESQHFNRLPETIISHWPAMVGEVVVSSDSEYLVICRPGTDFVRFVRLFTAYVPHLLKDEWPIVFRVYDSQMSEDAKVVAERFVAKTL